MTLNRRALVKTVCGGTLLAGTPLAGAAGNTAAGKPNIVLCMADDQGWGDMAYNGHPVLKTPHFDAAAAASLRFDRFYAACPVCTPTRGSVMTGRHPNRFGAFTWGHALRPREITVAEALKKAGYATGHFGKWHLGSVRKGSPVNPGASGFDRWLSAPNFYDNDPILSREGTAVRMKGESSEIAADAAIEFMRTKVKAGAPFLAVVWFGSPHVPHRASEKFRKMYADLDKKKQHFYGEMTGMDYAFGKLRGEIDRLGIRENTILWYCSDNGGLDPKTTGGRGKKGQVYEGGLRVPGILQWPAAIPGHRVTDVTCVTSDIYPTLLEIVGVAVDNQPPLDGISLVPLIKNAMKTRPKPIGFWDYPIRGIKTPSSTFMKQLLDAQQAGHEPKDTSHLRLDAGTIKKKYPPDVFPGHAAWLDWPWKLHRKQKKNQAPRLELYNLAADPMEKNDLSGKGGERVKTMKTALEQWLGSVVCSLNGEDYG